MRKDFPIRIFHGGIRQMQPIRRHTIILCDGHMSMPMPMSRHAHILRMIPLARSRIIRRVLLLLERLVSRVRLEIGDIDEIIDPSIDIRHRRLIRCKTPFIIDDEFEGVLAPFEVVDVGEIITGAMHRYLPVPVIEGSGNVDVSPTVFPAKDRGYDIIVCRGELGDIGLDAGVVHRGCVRVRVGWSTSTRGGCRSRPRSGPRGRCFLVVSHGRIGCGGVHVVGRVAWWALALDLLPLGRRRGGAVAVGVGGRSGSGGSWVMDWIGICG